MRMDLSMRCRNISVDSVPGPPKPPKPFKEPLTAVAEAVQAVEEMDWRLPVDLGVRVAVDPVNIAYHDPKSGHKLALSDLVFRFDAPSLAYKPITGGLRGDLAVDGHPLKTVSFSAD